MATVAKGVASFTTGGAQTATFTWVDVITGNPVTFGATPTIVMGPSQTVTADGAGVPYLDGVGAITTTGGTITMGNPGTCTVTVVAVG